jgi:arylsulfatase A-like enzyme
MRTSRRATAHVLLSMLTVAAAGCRSSPTSIVASRPLLQSEERLLVGVESRAVLAAKTRHDMRVVVDGECTLRAGFANLNTASSLVFRARRTGSAEAGAVLFEKVADPNSGWLDESVVLTGSMETPIDIELEIDGTEWHGGHWSQPLLTCTSDAPPLPSVVLISLDTLRADRAAAYGGNAQWMPGLNAFADTATVFLNTYAQYPQTLGSHATLFTSLYPSEHGAVVREASEKTAHRVSPNAETLARIFARAGYATAAFTENAFVGSSFGFDAGFDVYLDAPAALTKRNVAYAGAAEKTFAKAEEWLKDRPQAPFFLFVHTYEVHTPYKPPRWALHEMLRLTGAKPPAGEDSDAHSDLRSVQHNTGEKPMTPEEIEWAENLYNAEVLNLDRELNDFLQAMRRLEVYDQTIIAIVSDHGEEFGEHGAMGHGQALHEEHLRVPMIVRAPGRGEGQKLEPFVGLIDLAPTLLELAGVREMFSKISGRSLAGLFPTETPAPALASKPVFSELNASPLSCPPGQRAAGRNCDYDGTSVRDSAHAYIKIGASNGEHLYSLRDDRSEQKDLAVGEGAAELARYRELASTFAGKAVAAHTPTELDTETQRRLEALGYMDAASPKPGDEAPVSR